MATPKRPFSLRNWVQLAFLGLWLNPLLALPGLCGVVYHCHACPLAAFGCPIGVLAHFSAWHVVPIATIGLLLVAALTLGTLICGWACPFGLLQDLLAKIPTRKLPIPSWLGHGRYVVLVALVFAVPWWLGTESRLFICRLCPVGTLEAALPEAVKTGVLPSTARLVILGVLLAGAVFLTRRPWCRMLCPLGGILALGNRWSLVRIRWDRDHCTQCGRCAKSCPYGLDPTEQPNSAQCLRCLDCTAEPCGALTTALAPPRRRPS